jgi:sugar/nucleoside kinase (ribokinase family)
MRLGVLGTMVWDRIDHPDAAPVERWGGIAYSLAAAAAALPAGWRIRPLVKVGSDLADPARAFMAAVPGLELPGAVVETDAPNNRVHLEYVDRHHRNEHLTGGVPAWRWPELAPRLEGLDALYVNLISGFELDLPTARRLRSALSGPVYADLHSLLLDVDDHGHRVPRRLGQPDAWLAAFDLVQVNRQELALLGGEGDEWATAIAAVDSGLAAMLVTDGPAGVTVVAAHDGPRPWQRERRPPRVRAIPVDAEVATGDPTGCGDVWGATCFVALLRGRTLDEAARMANVAASRNVRHRGADGLYTFLTEVA